MFNIRIKARLCLILAGLLLVAALISALVLSQPEDPIQNTDTTIQQTRRWLTEIEDPERSVEAQRKLRDVGTNALPTLLTMLTARPSPLAKLSTYITGGSDRLHSMDEASIERRRALAGFTVMGRAAIPAIPALSNMIARHESPGFAVAALKAIGRETGPALSFALRSHDAMVRVAALDAIIETCANQTKTLESSILYSLNDPDPVVRCAALSSIQLYIQVARVTHRDVNTNIVARVLHGFCDSNSAVRDCATQAVAWINVRLE